MSLAPTVVIQVSGNNWTLCPNFLCWKVLEQETGRGAIEYLEAGEDTRITRFPELAYAMSATHRRKAKIEMDFPTFLEELPCESEDLERMQAAVEGLVQKSFFGQRVEGWTKRLIRRILEDNPDLISTFISMQPLRSFDSLDEPSGTTFAP